MDTVLSCSVVDYQLVAFCLVFPSDFFDLPTGFGNYTRILGIITIKNKDISFEMSCLVAGEGLEPPASGL